MAVDGRPDPEERNLGLIDDPLARTNGCCCPLPPRHYRILTRDGKPSFGPWELSNRGYHQRANSREFLALLRSTAGMVLSPMEGVVHGDGQ